MKDKLKADMKELPKEDVEDRPSDQPDVPRDDEASSGGDNSGTAREPQRDKVAPDLDPNSTD